MYTGVKKRKLDLNRDIRSSGCLPAASRQQIPKIKTKEKFSDYIVTTIPNRI